MFYGASQMLRLRSYSWGIAAGVLGILTCNLIGLVMGIWALVVLARQDVREMFNKSKENMKTNNKMIFATVAMIFLLVTVIIPFLANAGSAITNGLSTTNGHWPGAEMTQNFETNCPLATNGEFNIDNVNGSTDVVGWDQDTVVVKAVKHANSQEELDALKIEVDPDPNRLTIHTHQPSDSVWSHLFGLNDRTGWVDYTIQVPRGARLNGISSVNGHVSIAGVDGSIKASTVNGATEVHDARGDLDASTVNGKVSAYLAVLGTGQDVNFSAVNGKIDAFLPTNSDATISASSVNGSIGSDFSELAVTKDWPVGRHLKGVLGNGGATVKASVVNGAIHFMRNDGQKSSGN